MPVLAASRIHKKLAMMMALADLGSEFAELFIAQIP